MAKETKVNFLCTECGNTTSKWQGQCSGCGEWNTIKEYKEPKLSERPKNGKTQFSLTGYTGIKESAKKLSQVEIKDDYKFSTTNSEFDRVLGYGLTSGSVVLLSGTPGAGKSTLTLQTLCQLSENLPCIYFSGEESLSQIRVRANRLELPTDDLDIAAETDLLAILTMINELKAKLVVIDSLQSIYHPEVQGTPGGVTQLRECTSSLTQYAKQNDVTMIVICHVNKDNDVAGPKILQHIVDTVLSIDVMTGTRFRELRSDKNRFGSVNELGILAMMPNNGYLKEVTNPSAIFLNQSKKEQSGSMVTALWEGSRSMLVEIQSLVIDANQGNPRRLAVGLDQTRLSMLVAIITRHGNLNFLDQELYVNLVGGLKVSDPSTDLPIVLSMISSFRDKAIPQKWISFGEIGLNGEVRSVPSGLERIKQASQQGFTHCICPRGNHVKDMPDSFKIYPVETLSEAIDIIINID